VGEDVRVSIDRGLATVRLSRAHGNAINGSLADALARVCRELGADPAVRGAMLAADGKIFCPGLDLKELVELDRDTMEHFVQRFVTCVGELYAFPKPLVAAIHGHAIAGGCVLVLTADWRVLQSEAMIGLNEVRVGVPLPFGVAMILRESVPRIHLEEIALLGRNYRGQEALEAGLVHEVHAAEGFETACLERLDEFASRDAAALSLTKRYLRSAIVRRIREEDASRVPEFLDLWFRPETHRRIREIVDGLDAKDRSRGSRPPRS
jgi:enoyl-CoA hydratase